MALAWASGCGHLEAVKVLLQAGADVNSTDSDKKTALGRAAGLGFLSVVKVRTR
jgi:ankyrin repeat protein